MLEGPCAESEEKHEPASDADAAVVDSLKALDLNRPIREADIDALSVLTVIDRVYALSSLPCLIAAQHCESRRGGGSLAILPKASRSMICTCPRSRSLMTPRMVRARNALLTAESVIPM